VSGWQAEFYAQRVTMEEGRGIKMRAWPAAGVPDPLIIYVNGSAALKNRPMRSYYKVTVG